MAVTIINRHHADIKSIMPFAVDADSSQASFPASDTVSTVTITGHTGVPTYIGGKLHFSYSAAPPAGSLLTITGATQGQVFKAFVVAAGPHHVEINPAYKFAIGEDITIQLSDPGAGVTGCISQVPAWRIE